MMWHNVTGHDNSFTAYDYSLPIPPFFRYGYPPHVSKNTNLFQRFLMIEGREIE